MLFRYALSAIILVLMMTDAMATSMYAVALRDLSLSSEKIVQAKVTSIVTQWNRDSTQIVTYVRMIINDDLIGADEDNEIIIRQPGGKLGATTMAIEGTTTYRVGDANIMFLRADPSITGAYQTLGLYQGRYKITTDASGVQRVMQEVNGKVILYKSAGTTGAVETGNNLALDEFKSKVLTYRTVR